MNLATFGLNFHDLICHGINWQWSIVGCIVLGNIKMAMLRKSKPDQHFER